MQNNYTNFDTNSTINMGIKLIAYTPMVVAAHQRIRNDQTPIQPKKNFSLAENFLHMLFDKTSEQSESNAIDKDFIIQAEHGVNASTF